MHVKNIRNMKFNGQIFKIYKKKEKRKKKEIYEEFVEFFSKLVWRKTLFLLLSESANPDSSLIDDQSSKSRIRGEGWKQWRLVRGQ